MLYVPANLLPVMVTRTLFGTQSDTILSGVIYFWVSGAYGLAAIVFVASFLVPLFKIVALFMLVLLAQRRSNWRRAERARLYHLIELLGRWSMLDVFVVVLTMLASRSFDPKLSWNGRAADEMEENVQSTMSNQDQ